MGQQLPVGLYRSASVDGGNNGQGSMPVDECCFVRDERESKGWRAKQIAIRIGHLHTNGIVFSRRNRWKYLIKRLRSDTEQVMKQ